MKILNRMDERSNNSREFQLPNPRYIVKWVKKNYVNAAGEYISSIHLILELNPPFGQSDIFKTLLERFKLPFDWIKNNKKKTIYEGIDDEVGNYYISTKLIHIFLEEKTMKG